MKSVLPSRILFPSRLALVLLASAVALPTLAQKVHSDTAPQSTSSAAVEDQPSSIASQSPSLNSSREGFWDRVNPFARKKWANQRVDPLKNQLGELDEVNAQNARDIQGVDGRAQAGIRRAQSTADAANRDVVTQHEIPVYRIHSVAPGNAVAAGSEETKLAKTGSVHIRLMENSLAAQEVTPPHGAAPSTGAERP